MKIHLRGVAKVVLRCALKIAPPYADEWGRAMLGEMHHVQNDWDAFLWAASGAGVLTKHALFSLMIPGYAREVAASDSKFFAKENSMRKSTFTAAAVCLALTLLFFALPSFRQAFRISFDQGRALVLIARGSKPESYFSQGPKFSRVAEEARKNGDAEGLAFAAMHRFGTADSSELAEEAIRLDPKLTWIYAFMINGNWALQPTATDIERVAKLQQFDPENALPHLIHARQVTCGKCYGRERPNPEWQSAMAAAFASSKLDTYGMQRKDLEYRIVTRYGLESAYETASLSGFFYELTFPQTGNPKAYAKFLVNSGDDLAARGDSRGAERQYLIAAHFGEMVQPRRADSVETFIRGWYANEMVQRPYQQLATLYEKQGDPEQAQLFDVLARRAGEGELDDNASAKRLIAMEQTAPWSVATVNLSALLMFICSGIVFLSVMLTFAKSHSMRLSRLQISRATAILGSGGLIGLFSSAAALYLTYRPYAEIIRTYLRDGDPSRLPLVMGLLNSLDYYNAPHYMIYFWTGLIAISLAALVFMTIRLIKQSRQLVTAA